MRPEILHTVMKRDRICLRVRSRNIQVTIGYKDAETWSKSSLSQELRGLGQGLLMTIVLGLGGVEWCSRKSAYRTSLRGA